MVFEEEGQLDRLEAFASENGPRFYGLPLNEGEIVLERTPVEVPQSLPGPETRLTPFLAGQTLPWRLA